MPFSGKQLGTPGLRLHDTDRFPVFYTYLFIAGQSDGCSLPGWQCNTFHR